MSRNVVDFYNPELDFQRRLEKVTKELQYSDSIKAPHELMQKYGRKTAEVIDFTLNKES